MEEAERADDVYVISKGVVVAHDTPQALRAKYTTDTLTLVAKDNSELLAKLHKAKIDAANNKNVVIIRTKSAHEALQLLKKHEASITDFEFQHGNMDDVFLSLTDRVEEIENE